MSTDEEKSKLAKLLNGLEVPEVKLTERCLDLIREFHSKFDAQVEEEEKASGDMEKYENPYVVDKGLLEENERKLRELLAACKRHKRETTGAVKADSDPKRPWRTNSCKEKLVRIDNELKRHHETALDKIAPVSDSDMIQMIHDSAEENQNFPPVPSLQVKDVVTAAKKNLPNFQYKKIENSTATAILTVAHGPDVE